MKHLTYFQNRRPVLPPSSFPSIGHIETAILFDQISWMSVMGITQPLAYPSIVHCHQIYQRFSTNFISKEFFWGGGHHHPIGPETGYPAIGVYVQTYMGIHLCGIHGKIMVAGIFIPWFQTCLRYDGIPFFRFV